MVPTVVVAACTMERTGNVWQRPRGREPRLTKSNFGCAAGGKIALSPFTINTTYKIRTRLMRWVWHWVAAHPERVAAAAVCEVGTRGPRLGEGHRSSCTVRCGSRSGAGIHRNARRHAALAPARWAPAPRYPARRPTVPPAAHGAAAPGSGGRVEGSTQHGKSWYSSEPPGPRSRRMTIATRSTSRNAGTVSR